MRARQGWAAALTAGGAGAALVPDATIGWIAAAALIAAFALLSPRGVGSRLTPLAIVLVGVAAAVALRTYGVPG